jgi:putative copper resistance protein D
MAIGVPVTQLVGTVTLNLALAIAVGASFSSLWLSARRSGWAAVQRRRLRLAGAVAVAGALLASGASLWLEAAEMAEVPITAAGAAALSMLSSTHFGHAWTAGLLALVVAFVAVAMQLRDSCHRWWKFLNLSALAAFLYTRSMVSHAAAEGDFGLRILVDWVHLLLISVWVGEVFVAGLLTLAAPPTAMADDGIDCKGYAEALSTSATYALGGIVVTGLVNAWYNIGTPANLAGNAYSAALLLKLALVAIAVLLGGVNRVFVMPTLTADGPFPSDALRHFTLILRVEAAVLAGVLILAAVLSSMPPPTMG